MTESSTPSPFSHEQVVFCHDPATGLRAIIGIYSTALGPGARRHPVLPVRVARRRRSPTCSTCRAAWRTRTPSPGSTTAAARPSSSATPRRDKTEALLRAYGRFVECLGGRYVTACDVGTYVADMDVVARETRFATGRQRGDGGAGDSSVLTAYGVFQGMRAGAEHVWGTPTLAGRTVGIAGVGKVGRRLGGAPARGRRDGRGHRRQRAGGRRGARRAPAGRPSRPTPRRWSRADLDVYAPCALGGALDDEAVEALSAAIVCGAANNQLARPRVEHGTADRLLDRGILYAPDYVVNAGGVIQVADELHGFDFERARARTDRIFDTTASVLRAARPSGASPRPWRPTGSPSGGCRASAARTGSGPGPLSRRCACRGVARAGPSAGTTARPASADRGRP